MSILSKYKKIKDVTRILTTVRGEAAQKVSIAILAEPQVEAEILSILQVDTSNRVIYGASNLPDNRDRQARLRSADLAIVVISPGISKEDLEHTVKQAKLARSKLVIVAGREVSDWLAENLANVFRVSGEDVLFTPVSDRDAVRSVLVPRIVNKINGKQIALAASVPVFKEEVASRVITKTARENAVIGVAVFIPGADMPLLTINQIRMILRLSAVYNQELSSERLYEVLAVVGGGFAFRELAKQVLGVIPVAGWAAKGAIAYGGTIAMGELAKKYFNHKKGETVEPLATDREDTAAGREAEPVHKS